MNTTDAAARAEAAGQAAYELYSQSFGNRSAVTGDPLPTWEQARPDIRAAWVRAAQAAIWAWTAWELQQSGVTVPPLSLADPAPRLRW